MSEISQTPLWHPPESVFHTSNMAAYGRWLGERGYLATTQEANHLYEWSINHPAEFWLSIAEFFAVVFYQKPSVVLAGQTAFDTHWFPGATLNYAEHLLRGVRECPDKLAIIALVEPGSGTPRRTFTFAELGLEVARIAAWLRKTGVRKGDRVAGLLPNCPEAVIACLATASVGAIWSSCPPELSAKGILDRWSQIEPAIVFFVTVYRYGGKDHDRSEVAAEVLEGLGTVRAAVQVDCQAHSRRPFLAGREIFEWPLLGTAATTLEFQNRVPWTGDPGRGTRNPELIFEPVEFEHPLWILYSSGTTGIPKAIVHGHGGMLLEHLKALSLHLDLGDQDRFFWFTTAGWMMWNFLISGLGLRTTVVLYDGSPKFPDLGVLWRMAEQEELTYFGTSAPFLLACAKANLEPQKNCDLGALRAIGSTGAPLTPEGFAWVYRSVKPDVWLGSASGGTDVCTAFVLSHPWLPVYAGKLQCRGLGAPIQAWNEEGKTVWDEVGELVLRGPMPCLPVGFWNDPKKTRFKAAYFEHYPGVWRHGDWIEICSADGQCIIYGRSDSTLNRAGVRLGTSEFYRVVENIDGIVEALVVDTTGLHDRAGRLLLFVVLEEGRDFDLPFQNCVCQRLKTDLSPRYVPDEVHAVPEIPHTLNGKKLEVPVKRIFEGLPLEKAVSREAVGNPAALDFFVELAAMRRREA
jgi:acetoacetyl-CoA synthetase